MLAGSVVPLASLTPLVHTALCSLHFHTTSALTFCHRSIIITPEPLAQAAIVNETDTLQQHRLTCSTVSQEDCLSAAHRMLAVLLVPKQTECGSTSNRIIWAMFFCTRTVLPGLSELLVNSCECRYVDGMAIRFAQLVILPARLRTHSWPLARSRIMPREADK